MNRYIHILFSLMLPFVLLTVGCQSVPQKGGFSDVAEIIEKRAGGRIQWIQDAPEDAEVAKAVKELLKDVLTIDAAVQIALLNNRSLQAKYESLGVAQAELVEAGLLKNPIFAGAARFPEGSASGTSLELELVQDFLDILFLPARKKMANREFEETKLRVADAVLGLVAETKSAYYELQGSMQMTALLQVIAQAAQSAWEIAKRQHEAGNISDLDLPSRQAVFEQTKLVLVENEAQVLADRERLTRLMGLWGEDTQWKISDRLPDIPAEEIGLTELEKLALSQRLDLAAQRLEVEKLANVLGFERKWRWLGEAEVGVSSERELEGKYVTGPHLELELPVFNRGKAKVSRIKSIWRRSRKELSALTVEIRSEVREARQRLLAKRRSAEHYRTVLIPLRERIVAESQKHYNFMLIGVFHLLEAKQDEIEAYRSYLETVRDYWIARTELERVVGGKL